MLGIYVYSILYVHFRGRVRFKFIRHLTDVWTIISPINVLMYISSKVKTSEPYISTSNFPELKILRENWEEIKKEAMGLYQLVDKEKKTQIGDIGFYDIGFYSFLKTGWNRFYLKWYNTSYPSAIKTCPKTLSYLQQIPYVKAAMFAVLPLGAKLVLHRDPYAGSLRYHLGLSTPNSDKCRIYVDSEPYSWRDGEDVVFDETFLHYAINETEENRLILFCDIERPVRFKFVKLINSLFGRIIMTGASSPNLAGDYTGLINKYFRYIYSIRLLGKKIKRWNEKVYYIIKYSIFLSFFLVLFC